MPFDPVMIQPFRDELLELGIKELYTANDVDETIANNKGTLLMVINSVCGCAAGKARPAIRKALQNVNLPDNKVSVFAGQEVEATARLRERWLQGIPPSWPFTFPSTFPGLSFSRISKEVVLFAGTKPSTRIRCRTGSCGV